MNIIIAIIIFSLLIIFHELGHFLVAKLNHIHVYEFSLGLGPTLWGFHVGETKYCLKVLPFGGSCVMGEDEDFDENDPMAFQNKSVWARMAVVAAGPVFNFILAFLLALIIILSIGYDVPKVASVQKGSAAAEAGLEDGDVITALNGSSVHVARDVTVITALHPQDTLELEYTDAVTGEEASAVVVPKELNYYQLGIYMDETRACVTDFPENSPAQAAGMEAGDVIQAINGKTVSTSAEATEAIRSSESGRVDVTVLRDGAPVTVTVEANHVSGYDSGLVFDTNYYREKPGNVIQAVKQGCFEVAYWIRVTFMSLKMLVTGQVGLNDMSGPVGIVDTIGDAYEQSKSSGAFYVFLNMVNMAILLSANLGVMNLLPIPALDGGRLLFFIIEAIRRKPIDRKKEGMVHFIGFALLMVLMIVIMLNDIRKLFFL